MIYICIRTSPQDCNAVGLSLHAGDWFVLPNTNELDTLPESTGFCWQTLFVDEGWQGRRSCCQVCKGGYDHGSTQHSVAVGSSLCAVGLPMSPQHETASRGVVQERLLQQEGVVDTPDIGHQRLHLHAAYVCLLVFI